MINIRKLETELWDAADILRAGSNLTSNQYCMPVLGLIFLRYAYGRFKLVETEILSNRPSRGGRVMPVEASDFNSKSALFLPKEAQYEFLLDLPDNVSTAGITNKKGETINSIGEAVNNAMELIEEQSPQLNGVLPKSYTNFSENILKELLRIFNNKTLDAVGGDIIGRIYEYFLNKFAKSIASDDGVFFTPKSLVKMIVNIIEPTGGTILDPACGSGGMFIQSGDFINHSGMNANRTITFYGQEKVEYNAQLCLMNMAVHGLTGVIRSGDEANSFYRDAHNLDGKCDYVMANPPFNVDKVKAEKCTNAKRLPFGIPGVNKSEEFGNANYLWISYFYSYLNETGRAGFVMASSATDSQGKDKDIRQKLVETGHVDVMVSVGNNFFYTKSLPCSLWFYDKGKSEELQDKVLFIDARNYYTVVDRTLNEWSEWQLKNLNAIVWLYRGEIENYKTLLVDYNDTAQELYKVVWEQLNNYTEEIKNILNDSTITKIKAKRNETEEEKAARLLKEEALSKKKIEAEDKFTQITSTPRAYIHINKETLLDTITDIKEQQKELHRLTLELCKPKMKKSLNNNSADFEAAVQEIENLINEYKWLVEKFNDGIYADIPGLCKIATNDEIAEKGYSLTPGAYVGVAAVEDDGVDFNARMAEIHRELQKLQNESNALMDTISKNMKEMGL